MASTRAKTSEPRSRANSSTPSMALSVLSQSKIKSLSGRAMGEPHNPSGNRMHASVTWSDVMRSNEKTAGPKGRSGLKTK